ncbi:MAG: D-tyrosyl-tRNA(Tyr) deacylase [Desulfobacterales bacterium]|nr:MAG: D-tyrosyl-tRNA(Tyr) deacylase [Desulfobacterales bacterium]
MKAIVQRVSKAEVAVDGRMISSIGHGILVLLGVAQGDDEAAADYLVDKIINLRIFHDPQGKMNLSLANVSGELLVVSQFTLLGNCRKGRRPSFTSAAPPDEAKRLYTYFAQKATAQGIAVQTGQFQTEMDVSLVNQGPVTLLLESPPK